MHNKARGEHPKPQPKKLDTGAIAATVRWAQVLPIDFDGEDTSLTQAQLALLK
jgi:hypothetical protein